MPVLRAGGSGPNGLLLQSECIANQLQAVQNILCLVASLIVLGVVHVFFRVLDFLRQDGLVEIG